MALEAVDLERAAVREIEDVRRGRGSGAAHLEAARAELGAGAGDRRGDAAVGGAHERAVVLVAGGAGVRNVVRAARLDEQGVAAAADVQIDRPVRASVGFEKAARLSERAERAGFFGHPDRVAGVEFAALHREVGALTACFADAWRVAGADPGDAAGMAQLRARGVRDAKRAQERAAARDRRGVRGVEAQVEFAIGAIALEMDVAALGRDVAGGAERHVARDVERPDAADCRGDAGGSGKILDRHAAGSLVIGRGNRRASGEMDAADAVVAFVHPRLRLQGPSGGKMDRPLERGRFFDGPEADRAASARGVERHVFRHLRAALERQRAGGVHDRSGAASRFHVDALDHPRAAPLARERMAVEFDGPAGGHAPALILANDDGGIVREDESVNQGVAVAGGGAVVVESVWGRAVGAGSGNRDHVAERRGTRKGEEQPPAAFHRNRHGRAAKRVLVGNLESSRLHYDFAGESGRGRVEDERPDTLLHQLGRARN